MELGLFQLESLFLNPNRFLFFDLRSESKPSAPQVDQLLKKSTAIAGADVLPRLVTEKTPKDFPIVLLCEAGVTSARVAQELENAGFDQVYVVAGGVDGLLSEV